LLDLPGTVNRLDDGFGIGAAALPVRKRPLRIGFDQADGVPGLIASVLLPLPPFWVASTIVCIVSSFGLLVGEIAGRSTVASHSAMPSILAQDVPARSRTLRGIAAVRITKPCDDD
jgi:hypothetical protein